MFLKPVKVNQTMSCNHGLHLTVWILKSVTRSHIKTINSGSDIAKLETTAVPVFYGSTRKPFFISDDGYRIYFKPCMGNTTDTPERFCICFFAN